MVTRRRFIQALALAAMGPRLAGAKSGPAGFGPLVADPDRVLDLPAGFEYTIVSRRGEEMDDGLLVPARADGMGAFRGDAGTVRLVCNHENHPITGGPFGPDNALLERLDPSRTYDRGSGRTPGAGGTTTIVYDPRAKRTVRQHLSLAGTELNCAGGTTPWGSWLSCEECFTAPGRGLERASIVHRERRHGYVFEVPAAGDEAVEPQPIVGMGRFEHEAAAVNPASGVVYLNEDKHRGLLYRYLPAVAAELHRGGRLQALAIKDRPSFDTRNWLTPNGMPLRQWLPTRWIDLEDVDPDENDLRLRGFEAGAARFARGEGLCFADGSVFLTATIGGPERLGQVFEYRVSDADGQPGEADDAGKLRLLAECTRGGLLRHADNLTMSPWGDLIVCEDTTYNCGLVGLSPSGREYELANNRYTSSELAGVCFSPDGSILFVNVQERGLTLAITGSWPAPS